MSNEGMHFIGEHGKSKHAWFDASQLSPEYVGVRCLLEIGSEGGVICTQVAGAESYGNSALRRICTDAVVASETSLLKDGKRVVLKDIQGRCVELDAGDDDGIVIDDSITAMADDKLTIKSARLKTPWSIIIIVTVMTGFAISRLATGNLSEKTDIMSICALLFLTFCVFQISKAMIIKSRHDRGADRLDSILRREAERRRALEALISEKTVTA